MWNVEEAVELVESGKIQLVDLCGESDAVALATREIPISLYYESREIVSN